ncbi:MAG: aldehyde dehydrogenase family protein [Anaerolineae bacterium]|nr:aldehyde dehydrogenase family protein [Anaerolineae bacterium]GIK27751.1 MAG: aldehyde dehydrogenase [Chloroflexota bacterium]
MRTDILSPYDGAVVGSVIESTEQGVRDSIARAEEIRPNLAAMPAHRRSTILRRVSELVDASAGELALMMTRESGKPMRYTRGEVSRAVETFAFAAEEAKRIHGETVPLDAAKGGVGKVGYYVRVPVGVVAAITPFNFPLNLVAHKVAPAIAAGCPIVLKPAPATPLTALRLAEMFAEAGLPDGAFSVVVGGTDVGRWLTTDPRIAMITFTGSPPVARAISEVAGLRRTTFELGGNAAAVVDNTIELDSVVDKLVTGAFAYSGQVCISVQRIYVHRSRYDSFLADFTACTRRLKMGDPLEDSTELGPVISDQAADRIEAWVNEAHDAGAQVETVAPRAGRMLAPSILTQSTRDMKVMREEVFGPVVNVLPFDDFDDALAQVNDSAFGLQAAVFTRDLNRAMRAVQALEVGGVMLNDTPTFRVDHMPYGGNKASGVGREGPRFAVEDMTTLKMIVFNMA